MTPANFILMRVFWESANWMHRRQFFCFFLCLPNEGTTAGKPWIVADAPALQRIAALVAAEREPKSAKQIVNPSLTGVRIAEAPAGAPLSQRYHVRLRPAGSESWRNVPVYCFFQQHEYNWAPTTESHFVTFESTGGIEVEVTVTGESKFP